MRTKTILTILTAIFVFWTTGSILFEAKACGDYGDIYTLSDVKFLKAELAKTKDEKALFAIEGEIMRIVQRNLESERKQEQEQKVDQQIVVKN